jgi:hypothetical protein
LVSGVIPSQGATTSFYDAATNLVRQKFYEVEMVQ